MMKNFLNGLFAIAATVAMTIVSCQNEESFDNEINAGTIVEAQFQPVIPVSIRSLSSGDGGTGNVDDNDYDLRYILEVWSADGTTFVERHVEIADDYVTPVNFAVQLPAVTYKFVFWADFVDKGTEDDLTYNTGNAGGLKDIEWKASAYAISDNLRDAYYAVEDVDLSSGDVSDNVTLKRPFGKLRILATDLYGGGVTPAKAVLTYTHAGTPSFRKSFNALAGEPNVATINASGNLESVPELETSVTIGSDPYSNVYLLAFDYFLIPADLAAVSFDIELFDALDAPIAPAKSISNVPVGINKLTTVIGAFLVPPANASFDVVVSDDFDSFTTAMESVSLDKTGEIPLLVGEQETLIATVLPANAPNTDVTWSSSDEEVATVAGGVVTAVGVGSATITATSNADDTKTATVGVKIRKIYPLALTGASGTNFTAMDGGSYWHLNNWDNNASVLTTALGVSLTSAHPGKTCKFAFEYKNWTYTNSNPNCRIFYRLADNTNITPYVPVTMIATDNDINTAWGSYELDLTNAINNLSWGADAGDRFQIYPRAENGIYCEFYFRNVRIIVE